MANYWRHSITNAKNFLFTGPSPSSRLGCGLISRSLKNTLITETSTLNSKRSPTTMTTFGFKQRIMIGTWNIRTLTEPSRLEQVCREMSAYNIEILGLSEVRWLNDGSTRTSNGNTFIYSGNKEKRINGVGLVLSPTANKALLHYAVVSDRIISARFNSKFRNISVIQCYAPTEPDDDATKDNFYSQLEAVLHSIPGGDIKILLGDFNAKVGSDNKNLQTVMGSQGLGQIRNDNGERLVDLCARHRLFIGGTKFIHKNIHKYTWESPDGVTRNQIDHIMISKLFLGCLLDVRTRRGADIDSDHQLLIGTFKLRPAAVNKQKGAIKYNTSRLRDPEVAARYCSSLRDSLQSNNNEVQTWNDIAHNCGQTAKAVLGVRKKNHKPWISEESWAEIANRKRLHNALARTKTPDAKLEAKRNYRVSAKTVKYLVRADRERHYNSIAEEAEQAANIGNMRGVYTAIKHLGGKNIKNTSILKDQHGRDLTTPEEKLNRWQEFFSSASTQDSTIEFDISSCPWLSRRRNPRREISTSPPSYHEILSTLLKLKDSKAAGPDSVQAELLKYGAEPVAEALTPTIQAAWLSNKIPESWKAGVIITIPKKGDLSYCKNWRGITLLNIINKLLALLILQRLAPIIEPLIRQEQAGFRPGRSCADQINTIRIIVEQSQEYNSHLYMLFVDFERAFDTVYRPAIWATLRSKGVPDKIVDLIRELYNGAECRVRFNGQESRSFLHNAGVRQGCVLSPTLFLILLDGIMEQTNIDARNGIRWNLHERLNDIDYADDICLLAHRFDDIEQKLICLDTNARKVGLKININKTKLMRIGTSNSTPLSLNGVVIEDVDTFCYLGSRITKDGGSGMDIRDRINKARVAFHSLHKVWRANNISQATKLRIFNCSVKSVLLYSCSTWSTTQTTQRKLQTFVNRCLRQILRIFWPRWVTNEQLLYMAKCEPIHIEIKRRKWSWIGHILRRPRNEITRAALDWNPQGHRLPGRPRNTWVRMVRREAESCNKSWNQIKLLADDRSKWREFTDALCST